MNKIFAPEANFKMSKILQTYFLLLILSLIPPSLTLPVIDPSIAETLKTNKVANILISFTKSNSRNLLQQFDGRSLKSRKEKLNAFYTQLKTHADQVQATTLDLLKDEMSKRQSSDKPAKVHQIWVFNQIIVDNADAELVDTLSKLEGISAIEGEKIVSTIPPMGISPTVRNPVTKTSSKQSEAEWGVTQMGVPPIWKSGNKGGGVVIGIFDTGVRVTHEALRGNYRQSLGWFDGIVNYPTPIDDHGHGTLVAGIAVGQTKGIGVAPEANWIACRSNDKNGTGTNLSVLKCLSWLSCPISPSATDDSDDCSNAPHIINNSWIYRSISHDFRTLVEGLVNKWIENGIYPIFGAGNDGPSCGTVGFPSDMPNVLGVGNIAFNKVVRNYSSSGPPPSNASIIKPDIVAPGTDIFSSYIASDSDYDMFTGTSTAAPHVAGLAALIKSKFPDIPYQDFISLLHASAQPVNLPSEIPDNVCGGRSDTEYPNNRVGYGYVDAMRLYTLAEERFAGKRKNCVVGKSQLSFLFKFVLVFRVLNYIFL